MIPNHPYTTSEALLERALRTIPLGTQTFSKSRTQLPVGAAPLFVLIVVVVEWVVHFNIDWGKARYSEMRGYGPSEAGYWRANGFDQALHQLTYVAIAWAWVKYTAP